MIVCPSEKGFVGEGDASSAESFVQGVQSFQGSFESHLVAIEFRKVAHDYRNRQGYDQHPAHATYRPHEFAPISSWVDIAITHGRHGDCRPPECVRNAGEVALAAEKPLVEVSVQCRLL